MKITPDEYNLLADLVAELSIPDYDPNKHVTAKALAKSLGVSHRRAYERLERMVDEGKLKKEWVRVGKCRAWGYYK